MNVDLAQPTNLKIKSVAKIFKMHVQRVNVFVRHPLPPFWIGAHTYAPQELHTDFDTLYIDQ
jgi:hypothetical protein